MEKTLQSLTRQLLALSKCADEEKILPQEMLEIQQRAFAVQEEMMNLLTKMEQETQEIHEIRNIFQIREDVWDIMNKLAVREVEVKAKFGLKEETPHAEHNCCCGHHHEKECCCNHDHQDTCCAKKTKKPTKTCGTCKKEKKSCRKK